MSEVKHPDISTIKVLQEAWENGWLQIQRSLTYLLRPAKLGYIFYLIYYQDGEKVIYQGAYEINLSLANKLEAENRLILYIVYQLAKELE